jgi:elongation factor 1-beta
MGRVAATYNLMPDGPSIDMEAVKAKMSEVVPEGVTVLKGEVKPFAFGLKVLDITFMMNDSEGIMDKLEEKLRAIEGIQGVESTQVTLV